MKKKLALVALASGIASIRLTFVPAALPYTLLVVGALTAVGIGLMVASD